MVWILLDHCTWSILAEFKQKYGIYTCRVTRAIHLDLVSDMSATTARRIPTNRLTFRRDQRGLLLHWYSRTGSLWYEIWRITGDILYDYECIKVFVSIVNWYRVKVGHMIGYLVNRLCHYVIIKLYTRTYSEWSKEEACMHGCVINN